MLLYDFGYLLLVKKTTQQLQTCTDSLECGATFAVYYLITVMLC